MDSLQRQQQLYQIGSFNESQIWQERSKKLVADILKGIDEMLDAKITQRYIDGPIPESEIPNMTLEQVVSYTQQMIDIQQVPTIELKQLNNSYVTQPDNALQYTHKQIVFELERRGV
jgi:hypothetical protein